MGKWIFVPASLLILVHVKQIKAQEKYTASNGITYRVGDIVRLGKGSGDNGSFRFMYWGSSIIGDGNSCGDFMKMMILKEIKRLTPPFQDESEIIFVVKGDDFMTYSLRIERAIQSCEIKPCKSCEVTLSDSKYTNRIRTADELIKLKSLLDNGGLWMSEYTEQKQKLLRNGPGTIGVADELFTLKWLLDNGAIWMSEYTKQKQKVLKNGPGTFSVSDELLKLKLLLDNGEIRPWEYRKQKERLLEN